MSTTYKTVVVHIDAKQESLLRNRAVAAPALGELMRRNILRDEKHEVLHQRAGEEVTAISIDGAQGTEEYVIFRLVDHSNEQRTLKLRVRWNRFANKNDKC